MGGYVDEQTLINTRRMKEMEAQMQAAREAELKAATEAANSAIANAIGNVPVEATTDSSVSA